MPEDFVFWINSIIEDDPIPHEIKHIYLSLSFVNNICSLSLGGCENLRKIIKDFEYYPLEAQFFYNQSFNKINDLNIATLAVSKLLEYALENSFIKKSLKGKTIHIGLFMNEPEFSCFIK